MKYITRQTCYRMKMLNLNYSTRIIENQREKVRGEEGVGEAKAEVEALRRLRIHRIIPFVPKNYQ